MPSRRTYWVEEDGAWGLINEEVDEDAVISTKDSILWTVSPPPFASAQAFQAESSLAEDETYWFDGAYEWCYRSDGEWYAPLDGRVHRLLRDATVVGH